MYKRQSLNGYDDIYKNLNIKSDPFFLGKNFVDVSSKQIDSDFGNNFSLNLNNSELNKWLGPYESAFGHHIIYITNFKEGFYPELTSVLQKVEVDYMLNQKDIALKSFLNEIRSEYKIYINPDLQI